MGRACHVMIHGGLTIPHGEGGDSCGEAAGLGNLHSRLDASPDRHRHGAEIYGGKFARAPDDPQIPLAGHGLDDGHRQSDGSTEDHARQETTSTSRKQCESDSGQDAAD